MPPPFVRAILARIPAGASETQPLSPLQVEEHLKRRDIGSSSEYTPGQGVTNPNDFNNVGFFVLFALIGLTFVVASIWFFFWAKNGGFHFKKGDWDDYKSTVLRRKGPDGKTLSNATKSTNLGGGSVVGSDYTDTTAPTSRYTDAEKADVVDKSAEDRRKKKRHHKRGNRHDADVRAYREERPARVGGLNKAPEGTSYDGSTNPASSQPAMSEVHRSSRHHTPKSDRPKRDFSYNHGSEASFSAVSDNSQQPLRPHRKSSSSQQYRSNRERRSQGYYASKASEGSYVDPIKFHDARTNSSAASVAQVQNTKSYKHTIPGLSKGPAGPSSGFRRGGGGRRDSLSDSDGDETYRS